MIKSTSKATDVVSASQIASCNVFMLPNYAKYVSGNNSSVTYTYSGKYIMPVQIIKKAIFKYCVFIDEPFAYGTSNETEKQFLDDVCAYLKSNMGVQWVNQTPGYAFFMDYPTGAKHIPFGSHVVDLEQDEEVLFSNVHSKHRNVIKKAQKDGVVIEKGRDAKMIADYYKMDVETWSRSDKKSSGEANLRKQIEKLGDEAIIYMAYLDGEAQSGAIYYYNQNMCYYMHGANKNGPHIGSGNLLQWQAMLDMKAMGVKKFSFVGCRINEDEDSKYHGIQRFKERFGGPVVQGVMFKKTLNPFMFALSGFMTRLLNLKRSGQFKLNVDTIDSEIHKWPQ